MRKIVIAFVASLGVAALCATAYGDGKKRYLVKVKGNLGDAVEKAGGKVLHRYHVVRGLAVEVPEAAVGALRRNPNVVSIRPDIVVQAVRSAKKPSKPPKGGGGKKQPSEALEWNVDQIDAELAWASTTGAGVKVAVIDTGIDDDHPDLAANIGGGVNFVPKGRKLDPAKWNDDNGHGTHVAGIIAAVDNEIGVIGVAPEATLYAVKVLDARGSGWLSDVVAGIEWSVDNNMDVINMSLGASEGGGYKTENGTSMSTPHVAGVCALMLGLSDSLIPDDPRAQLQVTADDLYATGRDETSGFGLVDAEEAAAGD